MGIPAATKRPAFGVCLLLASLLLFGSEVLAWTNPPARPLVEWLLLLPAYLALSALLLDFIARYRVRDLFGVLLLTGIYSLTAALTINPLSMLNDLPRTLFTRVMGAHALIAAEMVGLFLVLIGGKNRPQRNLLIGCLVVGLAWGIWVKNWPRQEGFGDVSLMTMLVFGGGGLVLIAALLYVILPRFQPEVLVVDPLATELSITAEPVDSLDVFRLKPRGWLIVLGVLLALIALRLFREEIDIAGLILCPLLLALCWAILWFRGRKRGDTLLDNRLPVQPLPLPNLLVAATVFIGVGILGYNLPDIQVGAITPLVLIGLGFTSYGLAWLPTLSLVLGVQGYLRQLATRKM